MRSTAHHTITTASLLRPSRAMKRRTRRRRRRTTTSLPSCPHSLGPRSLAETRSEEMRVTGSFDLVEGYGGLSLRRERAFAQKFSYSSLLAWLGVPRKIHWLSQHLRRIIHFHTVFPHLGPGCPRALPESPEGPPHRASKHHPGGQRDNKKDQQGGVWGLIDEFMEVWNVCFKVMGGPGKYKSNILWSSATPPSMTL